MSIYHYVYIIFGLFLIYDSLKSIHACIKHPPADGGVQSVGITFFVIVAIIGAWLIWLGAA